MSLVFSNFIQSNLHKSCCDIDAGAVSIARYIEGGESTAETKIATPQYICVKCGNITVSAQAWHVFRYFEYMFLARKPVDPSKNSQRYPVIYGGIFWNFRVGCDRQLDSGSPSKGAWQRVPGARSMQLIFNTAL